MRGNFYAERQMWGEGVALHFVQQVGETFAVAQPVTMVSKQPGSQTEPMIYVSMTEAQQLMDALWHCGLRPTEGSGSAGSLAATERHLSDMRKLVFKDQS